MPEPPIRGLWALPQHVTHRRIILRNRRVDTTVGERLTFGDVLYGVLYGKRFPHGFGLSPP